MERNFLEVRMCNLWGDDFWLAMSLLPYCTADLLCLLNYADAVVRMQAVEFYCI
jgi:hypothetical protein